VRWNSAKKQARFRQIGSLLTRPALPGHKFHLFASLSALALTICFRIKFSGDELTSLMEFATLIIIKTSFVLPLVDHVAMIFKKPGQGATVFAKGELYASPR
jgi:hypothetical protein